METATKELLELNGAEGPPLDLLRKVLDILGAEYETPEAEEGGGVVRKIHDVYLNPFLEPNSVVFFQEGQDWTLITAVEQLTKVKCIAFRTQLTINDKQITKSDLINNPGTLGDRTAGRLLVRAKDKTLHLLFESTPGNKVGQCSCSVDTPDCLKESSPMDQTLDIYLSYKGDAWSAELTGKISVWHWK